MGLTESAIALEIENSGLWWLPEKIENKLSGQLNYQAENYAVLSLDGIFDEKSSFHEIILGEIDGCKVTLVNCMRSSMQKTYAGTGDSSSSKFNSVVVCRGHHFLRKADLVFNTISVRYSHLRHWLGSKIGGGEKERAHLKEIDRYMKQAIEKSLFVDFSSEVSLEIKGFLERERGFYYSPYNEETDVLFYLENSKLNEVIEIVDIFRNFLGICIDEKISIVAIEAQEEYGKVQLVLPSILKPTNKEDRIFFIPAPIECKLFLNNAKSYLANWYLVARTYEPMYQLFFSDNFEQLYVTTRFLNYAQAIEAYHARARKYEDRYFSDNIREIIDELTSFSETIKTVLSKPFSSAVLEKFKYLNRKSLRMILKDLFADFEEVFSIFINDKAYFMDRFVRIRNYYIHHDPLEKEPDYKEMVVLTENARLILLSIFLKELGLDEQNLKSAVCLYCRKRVKEIQSL